MKWLVLDVASLVTGANGDGSSFLGRAFALSTLNFGMAALGTMTLMAVMVQKERDSEHVGVWYALICRQFVWKSGLFVAYVESLMHTTQVVLSLVNEIWA
jgi:hypothetical protein